MIGDISCNHTFEPVIIIETNSFVLTDGYKCKKCGQTRNFLPNATLWDKIIGIKKIDNNMHKVQNSV